MCNSGQTWKIDRKRVDVQGFEIKDKISKMQNWTNLKKCRKRADVQGFEIKDKISNV